MARKSRSLGVAIRRKLASDPDLAAAVEHERFNVNVGSEIYRVRTEADLTQQELADRIETHQSVIARLEDADYDGHSLKMLQRVARAVNKRIEIRFVAKDSGGPLPKRNPPSKKKTR